MYLTSKDFLHSNNERLANELQKTLVILKRLAWFRFAAFIFIFIPFFVLKGVNAFNVVVSILFLILFLYLVRKNLQLDKQRKKLAAKLHIIENELLALDHSFTHFCDGKEYLDTNHFFACDLDLFGEGSVFQFLDRTVTVSGKNKLAEWILKPSISKPEIEKRQEAVKELAVLYEWRLEFLSEGMLFKESAAMANQITGWSEMNLEIKKIRTVKVLIRILPALAILAIIPAAFGISNLFLMLAVFSQWIMAALYWKKITEFFLFFGQKSELLMKYKALLDLFENQNFNSEILNNLKNKLHKPIEASKIFNQLKSIVKEFEYRQNLMVGFILNSLFLWDIRCIYKLWQWHQNYHSYLSEWLNVIAETDAYISLGNFASNHPEYSTPEMAEGDFIFEATGLGHPLLHPAKRVCNNLSVSGWGKIIIVTGANMAGKSTFLRTVGVNLILSRLGTPVCATKMVFSPVELYTNMRTTDSLLKDESYFFAELKRIKGVLDRLSNGERILVILDEMLKGTNSEDKYNGSKHLINKLLKYEAVALIATHDLKLSELESEHPKQVLNKCFEIRIENNEMVFDYLLNEGATKTMNATFLMKKMGII